MVSYAVGKVSILILLDIHLLEHTSIGSPGYFSSFNPYSSGYSSVRVELPPLLFPAPIVSILILLDIHLLAWMVVRLKQEKNCFNPYSSGYSSVSMHRNQPLVVWGC